MAVSSGLETAQNNNKNMRATSDMFKKSSVVVALCLLPTERTKNLRISTRNRKQKVL
jgi:hypothetical protein